MGKKSRRNRNRSQESPAASPVGGRAHQVVTPPAHRPPPPSITSGQPSRYLTLELLDAILARGVAERLNSKQALSNYLLNLLSDTRFHHLTLPLLKGLQYGPPYINARVAIRGLVGLEDNPTLLHWVCQWKMLIRLGWTAQDEMVDMAIRAGANVNATMNNKTSPLFFATKYGTLLTVDLLLKAGGNIYQHDKFGRTCLYNALEHPSPSHCEEAIRALTGNRNLSESTRRWFFIRTNNG